MRKKEIEATLRSLLQAVDALQPENTIKYEGANGDITYDHPGEETALDTEREDNEEFIPLNTRAEILRKAEELINGDRAQTYGPPEISFGRIADIWSAMGYRRHVQVPDQAVGITSAQVLTDVDAALLLIGMKLARTVGGPEQMDNWIDLAGYAGLGAELATPRPEESAAEDDGETLTIKWSQDIGAYVCPMDGYLLGYKATAYDIDAVLARHFKEWHPRLTRLLKDNNNGEDPTPVAFTRRMDDLARSNDE